MPWSSRTRGSGNSLDIDDVLFFLGLRKNFLSVSIMED
jgi:hypothetical protein